MSATERRQVPRTTLEKIAYIHIEPDNGGIVLNVSGDGLGFHSMAPVEKNVELHFSLKEQNRRIDVCGELIWTDEVQKIGGLRFTTLTNEAREQISSWVNRAEGPGGNGGSKLGTAFLRAFPSPKVRRLIPKIEPGERLGPIRTKLRLRMSGFSGGLATGLLISFLAGLIFAFSYTHRQQFGESLIRIGEHLISKPPAQSTAPPVQQSQPQQTTTPVITPSQKASTAPVPNAPPRASKAASHETKPKEPEFQDVVQILPPPKSTVAKAQGSAHDAQAPTQKLSAAKDETVRPSPPTSGQQLTPTSAVAMPPFPAPATASSFSAPAKPAARPDVSPAPRGPAGQVQAQSLSSTPALPLQRFFDLGKFKQQQAAEDLSDRVARLGMRSSVVNKGHLWMNSYQVLVGPYLTETEESKIHADLVTNGIKALPFERGSRGFAFRSALSVGGSKLPTGELSITWETYVAEAKVKFVQNGSVLASASGKWLQHEQKFAHNEYVYENLGGNSRPLLEIHFAGLDRALVFR